LFLQFLHVPLFLDNMDFKEIESKWKTLQIDLEARFGMPIDFQAVLYLIGVQELGIINQKFKKDEKVNLMHIAICTLLEPYGYYEFIGKDEDGWPHWNVKEKLPPLKSGQQLVLMKEAVVDYFEKTKWLNL
jgi:hypothetical protein